jgi:hypothetical protein
MMMIFKWIHLTSYPMIGAVQSAKGRRVHSEVSTLITMKATADKPRWTHRWWVLSEIFEGVLEAAEKLGGTSLSF